MQFQLDHTSCYDVYTYLDEKIFQYIKQQYYLPKQEFIITTRL